MKKKPAEVVPPPLPQKPKKSVLPELIAGAAAGVDVRTVRKLRRGQMTVDARLDLHGDTQDAAYEALAGFLASAQASGSRTVLVITGKSGVLRQMAPRWLNAAPNRARVLSFTPARPADGGEGALYVLLRKAKPK
jgi:DNA-nicking Smr family endonuclease